MAKNFDVCIESSLPIVRDSGLNTNKAIDFSGAPVMSIPGVYFYNDTTSALGTTQNSTPTITQLLGGIVTQTGATGAGTVTLPTGTQISTAVAALNPTFGVGYTFDCLFANLGGAQTLTITGQTGSTVIGTAAVGTGKNATMTITNTGTNTWNVYVVVSA